MSGRKNKNKFRRELNRIDNGNGHGGNGTAVLLRQNTGQGGRNATTVTADQLMQARAERDLQNNGGAGNGKKPQSPEPSTLESDPNVNNNGNPGGVTIVTNGVTLDQVQQVVNDAIAANNEANNEAHSNELGEIKQLLVGLSNNSSPAPAPAPEPTGEATPGNVTTTNSSPAPAPAPAPTTPAITNSENGAGNGTTPTTPGAIATDNNAVGTNNANSTNQQQQQGAGYQAGIQQSTDPPQTQVVTAADLRIQELENTVQQMQGVFSLYGMNSPSLNLQTNPLKEVQGKLGTLSTILQNTPVYRHEDTITKSWANQRDLTEFQNQITRWYREDVNNGCTDISQLSLYVDLEKSMKNSGLLSGVANAAGPTIGTPGSIGAFYLDVLTTLMRLTHNQSNIFWQFVVQVYDPTTKPNLTMGIPRFKNLPEVEDPDDFLLATPSSYTPTPAVFGTTTDSQSLESDIVSIGISEYGLGKNVSVGTRPVYISEFHASTSLLPLLNAVNSRLMQSYFSFEELKIRLEYEACTIVGYNNRGGVTFVPGDVGIGGSGVMTTSFVDSVYTLLYELQVPSFADGKYVFVMAPKAANQFKASLGDIFRATTPEQMMNITNILKAATGVEIGRVNQYFGCYNGFHIFIGNSFGVGNAGTVPTVNATSFGAGVFTTVESFAFGPGAVARGIALAAEIRGSGVNPYQRGDSWIWLSRENTAPMDLDINLDPAQQTRCIKVRTAIEVL